jgi:predicted negative regulator of RcsB-dependent stress response
MSDELVTAIAIVGGVLVVALLFGWFNRDADRQPSRDDPRAHTDDPQVFETWVKDVDKKQAARDQEIANLATDRRRGE